MLGASYNLFDLRKNHMSSQMAGRIGGVDDGSEPDEYNLYLGFMIPIGAILALCVICLFVVSWQIICPKCSNKYCPKFLLSGSDTPSSTEVVDAPLAATATAAASSQTVQPAGRRTSITLLRRYSDTPPSYEQLQQLPPSYNSVVIIEEESPRRVNRRTSSIRTYVYDPSRRISIEVHDEDTIRVVEELLSRRSSITRTNSMGADPPGYHSVVIHDKLVRVHSSEHPTPASH